MVFVRGMANTRSYLFLGTLCERFFAFALAADVLAAFGFYGVVCLLGCFRRAARYMHFLLLTRTGQCLYESKSGGNDSILKHVCYGMHAGTFAYVCHESRVTCVDVKDTPMTWMQYTG